MKFTLSWLKEHLDTKASVEEVAETLTRIGLEVEERRRPGAALTAFTVAHVVSGEQHPNADKLQVCEVDTGTERLQVVCGAPNARAGLKSASSRPSGAYVPGIGITLQGQDPRRRLQRHAVFGARAELSDEHNGIIELRARRQDRQRPRPRRSGSTMR